MGIRKPFPIEKLNVITGGRYIIQGPSQGGRLAAKQSYSLLLLKCEGLPFFSVLFHYKYPRDLCGNFTLFSYFLCSESKDN